MIFLFLTAEDATAAINGGIRNEEARTRILNALREDAKLPSGDDLAPLMVAYRYGLRECAVVYENEAHADRAWRAIRAATLAPPGLPQAADQDHHPAAPGSGLPAPVASSGTPASVSPSPVPRGTE